MQLWHKLGLGLALALTASVAQADTITIDVGLDSPLVGKYRLVGQSSFIQTRTDSGTSGGQLDNVESGSTSIGFDELFPPASLADYLDFAYFGIIETLDETDTVIDTSLIIAYASGAGVGQFASDDFPYTEAELVNAFTGAFDSPEFLSMSGFVPANASTRGAIGVPPIGRPGATLDLVAFIGGVEGDVGVKVGTLGVVAVPEPSTFGLLAIACGTLLAVRRRVSK